MTEAEEVQKLQLELCLLEKDCPGDYPGVLEGSVVSDSEETRIVAKWHIAVCPQCHGSNKVPLLVPQLVREECPCCGGMPMTGGQPVGCEVCDDRGWVPTDDPWRWFEAVGDLALCRFGDDEPILWSGEVWPQLDPKEEQERKDLHAAAVAETPKLAFFRALAKALGMKLD